MYLLDLGIALSIVVVVFLLTRFHHVPRSIWPLFWVGVLIGSTWEFGYHFTGPTYWDNPSYTQGAEFPIHPILQPISHSIWDGGLFLLGLWLVWLVCPAPRLQRFSVLEQSVLVGWGMLQGILIELLAVTSDDGWQYTVYSWNPALFTYNDKPITLFPLAAWVIAPIVFYWIALRIHCTSR